MKGLRKGLIKRLIKRLSSGLGRLKETLRLKDSK